MDIFTTHQTGALRVREGELREVSERVRVAYERLRESEAAAPRRGRLQRLAGILVFFRRRRAYPQPQG